MEWAAWEDQARALGCAVTIGAPMAEHTSFKIGGPADRLVIAPHERAAVQLLQMGRQAGLPIFLIGNGSNLLVGDRGIRGAVLRLDGRQVAPTVQLDGCTVRCAAGMTLKRLCQFARDKGLAGLEFAYGIPGTVGGAVYMNAGAYGGQMADVLTAVSFLDEKGRIRTVPASELALGYRHSRLMEREDVVLSAQMRLTPDDPAAIGARMEDFLRRRREKQPLEYPSAGSFFKRPEGHFAGALIEECGLKGLTVGGAQISEKHAGFVINRGEATAADVRRLAEMVQETVWTRCGVRLEPEVRFVGEF